MHARLPAFLNRFVDDSWSHALHRSRQETVKENVAADRDMPVALQSTPVFIMLLYFSSYILAREHLRFSMVFFDAVLPSLPLLSSPFLLPPPPSLPSSPLFLLSSFSSSSLPAYRDAIHGVDCMI